MEFVYVLRICLFRKGYEATKTYDIEGFSLHMPVKDSHRAHEIDSEVLVAHWEVHLSSSPELCLDAYGLRRSFRIETTLK